MNLPIYQNPANNVKSVSHCCRNMCCVLWVKKSSRLPLSQLVISRLLSSQPVSTLIWGLWIKSIPCNAFNCVLFQQQMATANASSGAQFPKPSYNSGYGSTGYDTLSQSAQDYNKSGYVSSGGQQSKGQNVTNPPQSGAASDISSSMYGKSHVALNKVNVSHLSLLMWTPNQLITFTFYLQSYEKQSFHSGTPPPFNLAGSQTAGATSGQAYGAQQLYIQAMPAIHNMNMHQPIHQVSVQFLISI